MAKINIEKTTGLWMGLFVLVMSLVYIFVTLGKTEWVSWIAIVWGFFLAVMLFIEGGTIDYFQQKQWKKISFGDLVVWLTISFSVVIFVNTFLLIGTISQSAPSWLLNFAKSTGVIGGVGGAILGIIHIMMPRFK